MRNGLELVSSNGGTNSQSRLMDDPPMSKNSGRILLSDSSSEWQTSVVNRLQELVSLSKGWDGYHGLPVSFANAHFALRMLESTCPSWIKPPQIVPGPSGDLQVEWHTLIGDVELHVVAPNVVHAWRATPNYEDGEEFDLTNDFSEVAKWVQQVMESTIAPNAAAA